MSTKALPLITGEDNPILRKKSQKVAVISKEVKKLLEKMQVTVRKENGLGLAAPQVGENIRVVVAQIAGSFLSMINPEILEYSEETETMEEGCLSLPGLWGMVMRPKEIMMRFQDERGQKHSLHLSGLNARVVQHEVDHLDGILFLDRIPEGAAYEKTEKKEEPEEAL